MSLIMTQRGWKQLQVRRNDVGQPIPVKSWHAEMGGHLDKDGNSRSIKHQYRTAIRLYCDNHINHDQLKTYVSSRHVIEHGCCSSHIGIPPIDALRRKR